MEERCFAGDAPHPDFGGDTPHPGFGGDVLDRRAAPRTPAHVYFNKYIDGVPYLCEALEISMSGMLVRRIHEPERDVACYAVELAPDAEADPTNATSRGGLGGAEPPTSSTERVWLCASPVWTLGRFEALSFVGQSAFDRLRLADLMTRLRGPARPAFASPSEPVIAEEALDS